MSDTLNLIAEKKALQAVGRDAAWTFKGLYKTSDWFTIRNGLLLIVPIGLTLYGFGASGLSAVVQKWFEVAGLGATVLALITQGAHGKAALYQKHANEFKDIYDEAAAAYLASAVGKVVELNKRLAKLRQKTIETPISLTGRWWAKLRISKEMDLRWVDESPIP